MQAAIGPAGPAEWNNQTMMSFAVSHTEDDAYAIELPATARLKLAALPERARAAILRRLAEIAHVAGALRTWMSDAGDVKSTLYFQLAGYAVSYAMSDARRVLQVLGVVPLAPEERSGG